MDELWAHVPMALAVLIIGLIVYCGSRKPLHKLLDRIRSLKHGDTSIDMGPQAEEQQVRLSESPPARGLITTGPTEPETVAIATEPRSSSTPLIEAADDRANVLRTVGVPPLVIEQEAIIRKDLRHIPSIEEREKLMVRNLALAQLQSTAERIYRVVFGSQLAALQHLNLYGATSREKLGALFYEPATQKWTEVYQNYTADRYFHFLVENGLIGLSTDDKATITIKGKALLEWIAGNGLLMNKAF
jgi:hypothetical protein